MFAEWVSVSVWVPALGRRVRVDRAVWECRAVGWLVSGRCVVPAPGALFRPGGSPWLVLLWVAAPGAPLGVWLVWVPRGLLPP